MNELDVRLQALEMTSLRLLLEADAGGQVGAEPSMLKLKGSELVQAMDELLFEAVGHWAVPQDASLSGAAIAPEHAEYVASGRYHHRGYTIAGGSSEVALCYNSSFMGTLLSASFSLSTTLPTSCLAAINSRGQFTASTATTLSSFK